MGTYSFGANSKCLIPVWTNNGNLVIKIDGVEPIHSQSKFSPRLWKRKSMIPPELLIFGNKIWPIDNDTLSQIEIWESHMNDEITKALERIVDDAN